MNNKSDFTWRNLAESLGYFLEDKKAVYIFWNFLNLISQTNILITPFIVGLIIDFFTSYSSGESLAKFYIYLGIIVSSLIFLSFTRMIAKKRISGTAIETQQLVRTRGFERLLGFSLKWHDEENTGNRIQRINNGSEGFRRLILLFSNQIAPLIVTFAGILSIFAILNINFFLFFILYIFIFFFVAVYYDRRISVFTDKKNRALEIASGTYFESASNILSIKSLGTKASLLKNVSKMENLSKNYLLKIRDIRVAKILSVQIVNGLAIGIYFLMIGFSVVSGEISVGFIATAFVYFNSIMGRMFSATQVFPELIEYKSSIGRVMPIFNTKEENYFGDIKFPRTWKYLSFENVSFSYNERGEKGSLKDVSLVISRKQKVGIVGHSGSGKSTLVKLLLGLYKVNKGKIKVDNENFYELNHDSILRKISPAMQETELFNLSLKENITMLKRDNKKLFEKAISISQLKPIINKLPRGINTLLGEKGYKLSGGERQRIGIARAIFKNPEILILDEATSSLDNETEMKIQRGIETLDDKTILIVAHRLSTLKNVDRIVVFDKGKIIEQGDFKELVKNRDSKFYKLWNMQQRKRK